ncbi:MAG TPA: hypothetical protein VHO06_10385 [Polyangia bacterium]|nr:hypothetical protein [Polyangia bacterium]
MALLSARGGAHPGSRRRRAGVLALGLALVVLAAAGLTACFNPDQPGCAFSCASDGLCPSGYSCGSDRVCHRTDGQGSCPVPADAAATDASGQ